MAHKYTKSIATATGDGLYGIHLSTGEFVFVAVTSTTNADLCVMNAARTSVTVIASLTLGTTSTTWDPGSPPAVARDNLDNLFVVGIAGDATTLTLRMQAFTKGSGLSWTNGTVVSATRTGTGMSAAQPNHMVWCNTGGGTSNKGHLLWVTAHDSSATPQYAIVDAGALLANTGTLTASASNPTFLSGGVNNQYALLSPDGFGATNGISVIAVGPDTVRVGAWAVNSSGALSTNTSITAALLIAYDPGGGVNQFAIPVHISSNLWAIVGRTGANAVSIARYSATAQLTAPTSKTTTTWDSVAPLTPGMAFWAMYDASSAKVKVYFRDNTTKTTIKTIGATVASGVTWDSAETTEDTGVGTTAAARFFGLLGDPVDQGHVDYGFAVDLTMYGTYASYNVAPNAPTLTAPASGSSQDLAAGHTFTWTFSDPNAGDTQSAYYFRRKIVGAGSYEYWNAGTGTWQGTEVKNTSTSGSVTFTASKWTNGNSYQWSVATEDALGVKGPYASDLTVVATSAATVTVTAPSGSVTSTSRPDVTWSMSDPETDPQQTYQVKIESGAYGTTPGAGTAVLDSGEVSSLSARSWTPTADLANSTTYRAFVRVKTNGQYSAWAYTTFTMALTAPSAPTLATSFSAALNRVTATITGTHATASFPTTTFRLEKSDDGGATWQPVRNGTAVGNGTPGATPVTIYDYEAPLFKQRQYRAFTDATV